MGTHHNKEGFLAFSARDIWAGQRISVPSSQEHLGLLIEDRSAKQGRQRGLQMPLSPWRPV